MPTARYFTLHKPRAPEMNPRNLTLFSTNTWLPGYLALVLCTFFASCSPPESLFVGSYELSYQVVAEAEQAMKRSFPGEGDTTLRAHLMQFGLGQAAILHQAHPLKSASSLAEAKQWADKVHQADSFMQVLQTFCAERGLPIEADGVALPHPSGLGASVAAAVAQMENGDWAGPIATSYGWELILLEERFSGARNRAQISLYRMQFPVGSDADRAQAKKDWDTLPLRGNPELLLALPLSFRRDRLATETE